MSKAHIIVGATDTGKSFFIKNTLRKVPSYDALLIYDINNEYQEFSEEPFEDFETFAISATRCEHAIIVFEEATIFLNNRGCSQAVNELLVRKKHTKNFVFLVFHSVRSIPRYVYELSNYITIFKTNDSPDLSARELKDDRIKDIMIRVKNNQNKHYFETLKIY
jgi:hypothetical protein